MPLPNAKAKIRKKNRRVEPNINIPKTQSVSMALTGFFNLKPFKKDKYEKI